MGLFGLFGSGESSKSNDDNTETWKHLTSEEQLEVIEEASASKPVAIFKHSTRCGISSMVLRQLKNSFDIPEDELDMYYLDLLKYRNVSDEVAARFGVLHQSPQLIVIKDGEVVHHASHHSISFEQLSQLV